MSEALILRLTSEELCLLQRNLAIDELPGIATDLLPGLNDVQKTQALTTAEHTLRGRNLVGWDDAQQRVIHPVLAQVLLDYAHPRHTLFVDTYIVSTRVLPFFYVFGEQAIYEHCQPEPDVLQFRILASHEELGMWLYPNLGQPELSTEDAGQEHIVQCVLNAGVKVVQEDEQAAYRLFSDALSQPLAKQLAAAYHAPKVVQYMARWQQTPTPEHPIPNAALTILQGQEQSYLLWLEEPEKGEDALVAVQPAISTNLRSCLAQMLPPAAN